MSARSSALLLALLLAFPFASGCDTSGPALPLDARPASAAPEPGGLALAVPLDGASRGDFLYAVDPLAEGEAFSSTLSSGDGAPSFRLASRRTPGTGHAVWLEVVDATPDSVVIEYLAEGSRTAAPVRLGTAQPSAWTSSDASVYWGGEAGDEPTSYHYEVQNGVIIIVWDYDDVSTGGLVWSDPGTTWTTPTGERARVTDVRFTIYGVTAGPAEAVRFVGARPFHLAWFEIS